MVIHRNVVDDRLRFLNRFSGPANHDLVLLGRLSVLGQIQFSHGVIHLHDVRDDLATSMSDLAVSENQHLDTLLHRIQRLRPASEVGDHFERVVGELLGVLLQNLLRDLLRDVWLVPERFGSCWEKTRNLILSSSSVVAS